MLLLNWTKDDTIHLKGSKSITGVKIKATAELNASPGKFIKPYQTKQHYVFQIFCL